MRLYRQLQLYQGPEEEWSASSADGPWRHTQKQYVLRNMYSANKKARQNVCDRHNLIHHIDSLQASQQSLANASDDLPSLKETVRRQYRLGSLMHIKAGAHNFFQRLDEEVREFEAKHMKREGQGLYELPEKTLAERETILTLTVWGPTLVVRI